MGGSVTYCTECGVCNWAGKEKCEVCGGDLEPALRQALAHLRIVLNETEKILGKEKEASK